MSSGLGYAFTIFFFYDVIDWTMSRNCGSKFGCILSCDMNL